MLASHLGYLNRLEHTATLAVKPETHVASCGAGLLPWARLAGPGGESGRLEGVISRATSGHFVR